MHPAWIVLGAVTLVMLAASGVRSVFGVFIKPMEAEFGWDRAAMSGVAALSLLLLGAVGPLRRAGWPTAGDPARSSPLGRVLVGVGAMRSAMVASLWQLYLTAGFLTALGAGGVGWPRPPAGRAVVRGAAWPA